MSALTNYSFLRNIAASLTTEFTSTNNNKLTNQQVNLGAIRTRSCTFTHKLNLNPQNASHDEASIDRHVRHLSAIHAMRKRRHGDISIQKDAVSILLTQDVDLDVGSGGHHVGLADLVTPGVGLPGVEDQDRALVVVPARVEVEGDVGIGIAALEIHVESEIIKNRY